MMAAAATSAACTIFCYTVFDEPHNRGENLQARFNNL